MTRSQISAIEYTGRGATSYRPQQADDAARYRAVLVAALPAAAILLAAATMLTHLLIA